MSGQSLDLKDRTANPRQVPDPCYHRQLKQDGALILGPGQRDKDWASLRISPRILNDDH